jgi:ferredoxin
MKVYVDRDLCIGAAPCVSVAPKVFELDEEGKAIVLPDAQAETDANGRIRVKTQAADDDTLMMSAQSCPVQAIFVYDDEGKQLFPPA